ncbi:MAG: hypothetical protein ACOC98_14635 [Thermodesulfobacteriota bacterium]
MNERLRTRNKIVSQTMEHRTRPGHEAVVAGWQQFLARMLEQMAPYLRSGHLVTFQQMQDDEKALFEALHGNIEIPETVQAIFIPRSVLNDMMYPDNNAPENQKPSEAGIILAIKEDRCDRILNAVFAFPPFTPAVDVYEEGKLLAGYVYNTIEECAGELSGIIATYLNRSPYTG